MDDDDPEIWYADPPEPTASEKRAAMRQWLREHPNEFWYHAAVVLFRQLIKVRGEDPEHFTLGIAWAHYRKCAETLELEPALRWWHGRDPQIVLKGRRCRPDEVPLDYGPVPSLDVEPD